MKQIEVIKLFKGLEYLFSQIKLYSALISPTDFLHVIFNNIV